MRFLANENIPGDAVAALRQAGHDTAWIRSDSPGMPDDQVLARAVRESRILLTFDKDFGELAFRRRMPAQCGIVLFRVSTASPSLLVDFFRSLFTTDVEWKGHFTVVEDDRIRMRPLPQ